MREVNAICSRILGIWLGLGIIAARATLSLAHHHVHPRLNEPELHSIGDRNPLRGDPELRKHDTSVISKELDQIERQIVLEIGGASGARPALLSPSSVCGMLSQLGKLSLYFTLYETAAAKALLQQLKAESEAKKNRVRESVSSDRDTTLASEGIRNSQIGKFRCPRRGEIAPERVAVISLQP